MLPTYFYGVLVAFFGSNTLISCWNYLTQWEKDDVKVPLQFRLNPKLAGLYIAASTVVAAVAWGASVKLIQDTIHLSKPLVDTLIAICISNGVFVTLYILFEFYSILRRDSLLYGNKNDAQWLTQISAQIDEMMLAIELLEGKKLVGFLKSLPEYDLEKFGITEDKLKECESKITSSSSFFAGSYVPASTRSPLIENDTIRDDKLEL